MSFNSSGRSIKLPNPFDRFLIRILTGNEWVLRRTRPVLRHLLRPSLVMRIPSIVSPWPMTFFVPGHRWFSDGHGFNFNFKNGLLPLLGLFPYYFELTKVANCNLQLIKSHSRPNFPDSFDTLKLAVFSLIASLSLGNYLFLVILARTWILWLLFLGWRSVFLEKKYDFIWWRKTNIVAIITVWMFLHKW